MLRRPLRVIDSDGHLIAALPGVLPETLVWDRKAALHAGDRIAGSSDLRMPRSGAGARARRCVDVAGAGAISPPRQATCAWNVRARRRDRRAEWLWRLTLVHAETNAYAG